MKYQLMAFDMDGTLLWGEGCWVKLHRHFGTLHIGDRNLADYEKGRFDYIEFMRRDIRSWMEARKIGLRLSTSSKIGASPGEAHDPSGGQRRLRGPETGYTFLYKDRIHVSEVEGVLADYRLAPGTAALFRHLEESGTRTAIVSSGIDLLARRVARRLGIHHVHANTLPTDPRGHLTLRGLEAANGGGVDPTRKHQVLRSIARREKIPLAKTVAVGDSRYDRSFLRAAGLGVAIRGDPILEEAADLTVRDLRELREHL
ncbi:MAG: HAD-IB family phosphatase [Euryarchaeota archaeon]|nr:HAD-IB family phosphatase [Euryarchaeota archaeon]